MTVIEEAKSWIGTPFIAHAQVKGDGVDCANLIQAIFYNCGKIKKEKLPKYSLDGGVHITKPYVEKFLFNAGFKKFDDLPEPGHVVAFKFGRIPYHLGIVVSDITFIHAIPHAGVIESRLDDSTWQKKINGVYSL